MARVEVKIRKRKSGFLENYRLDDAYQLKPDRENGKPGLLLGSDPEGTPVLVKVWPRTKAPTDQDLKEIWRHELRQLHRLRGYPGAASLIANLQDSGEDADGFYLVLATGQRRPLSIVLQRAPHGHWLKHPSSVRNRARIWRNIERLASGLEVLHSQALLHRNLDSWAVLTAGGDEADFQLTGFEWSMRIPGAESVNTKKRKGSSHAAKDSFLRDWQSFGWLACQLVGAETSRILDSNVPPFEVSDHLSADEAVLLRMLVQVISSPAIDGELVAARIERIVRVLSAEVEGKSAKLHIAFHLGRFSDLSREIRRASNNEIDTDDAPNQIEFIRADLEGNPLLIAVASTDGEIRLRLQGKKLLYRLDAFRPPRTQSLTWDFAACESVSSQAPAPVDVVGKVSLSELALEMLPSNEAAHRFARMRGKCRSWLEFIQEFQSSGAVVSAGQLTHKALTLIQLLDVLFASADVFPVSIKKVDANSADDGDGQFILRVTSRFEQERESLSAALNLLPPGNRLTQLLSGDGVKPEAWILSDSRWLGEKSPSDTEWKFKEIQSSANSSNVLVFTGTKPAAVAGDAYLITEDSVGRDVQFRRRLKALRSLKDHEELLEMMADPRQTLFDSHERVVQDEAFLELDESKQVAMTEIVGTIPIYMVQGPPGVGKTRLVRELARRRFVDEPTTRMLLSAQSNSAVDHLMDELDKVLSLEPNNGPLVVRCRSKDESAAKSKFDIQLQSKNLVQRLAGSQLASELPIRLKSALSALAKYEDHTADGHGQALHATAFPGRGVAQALRAFEGAVVRSANIVFATTNSGELERLIEERGQFDWAIIEEAGKATGSELVSPMLLSHRRLMIGDHKQLPPFAADKMIKILENPASVEAAVNAGRELVGRSLRDETTDEILDDVQSDEDAAEDLPALCAESLRVFTFFEGAIEAEFARQEKKSRGRPIAKRLTEQHRMHPEIAKLVSRCFYDGELATHLECVSRFKESARPFTSSNRETLPETPIVVVDMPYIQAEIGARKGERYPRWHNPEEVLAAEAVVRNLVAGAVGKQPTLAVLSPYSQQVKRLGDLLEELRETTNFSPPSAGGDYCHTVDSFQGSEADVVIVSLVRNNSHSNVLSALGFLSDPRRMNVLLSRARWQLILITSLAFLREVVAAVEGTEAGADISFLNELLNVLQDPNNVAVSVVPAKVVMGSSK